MPTVLLAGAFGQRNPGDEALLHAFRLALPDWRCIVTTSRPHSSALEHGCDTVRPDDPVGIARSLLEADAVVYAGGTVFKVLGPHSGRAPHGLLRRAVAMAFAVNAMRRPLALVGVGAGDLPDRQARVLARQLVQRADLLVLRDEESAWTLAGIGAAAPYRVGADAAWTLFTGQTPSSAERDGAIVALSSLALGPADLDWLVLGLRAVRDAGLALRLQPWQVGGSSWDDVDMARMVAARLGGVPILAPPADLIEARDSFAAAQVVVGLRFHSLVAAAAARTPFIAVRHEQKLAAMARRFRQPAIEPGAPLRAWSAAISAAMRGVPSDATAQQEIETSRQSLLLLRLVLERGQGATPDLDGLRLEPDPATLSRARAALPPRQHERRSEPLLRR